MWNSLDSNRERVVHHLFSEHALITTTATKKCSGECMKPEPSEVKTEQSIKTGFNFASK